MATKTKTPVSKAETVDIEPTNDGATISTKPATLAQTIVEQHEAFLETTDGIRVFEEAAEQITREAAALRERQRANLEAYSLLVWSFARGRATQKDRDRLAALVDADCGLFTVSQRVFERDVAAAGKFFEQSRLFVEVPKLREIHEGRKAEEVAAREALRLAEERSGQSFGVLLNATQSEHNLGEIRRQLPYLFDQDGFPADVSHGATCDYRSLDPEHSKRIIEEAANPKPVDRSYQLLASGIVNGVSRR
jgi:hypothetical protein